MPSLPANPTASPPHYSATYTRTPPIIDGRLDDAAWAAAQATDAFVQKIPDEAKPPTERTTMRIVYDDDAIYVAFDCSQTKMAIVERLTRRDRQVEADAISVAFDTRRDGKTAFEFVVNAAGVLADAIRFNDTDYSSDFDENWDARTEVRKDGWSVEMRIPLRILRFSTADVQSWGMEARRYISNRQESDEWAYFPRSAGGEVSHYGKLDNLRGLRSGSPVELRPFVVGRFRRRDAVSGQLASGSDLSGSAGIDLKWHPTQDLTLDATINPDFAQVEADQVVLNLTTFETYYPEKRPFFLEGIETFATPFQLLYTRRIGRAAPSPTLRTGAAFNEQLVDISEPATIYGASKLTGRLAEGWSVGTLQAVTARNDVKVSLADGTRVNRLVDPLSSFNVVRLKRDIGDNAHVGLMATSTTHAEAATEYPILAPGAGSPPGRAQQLCPTGTQLGLPSRCFNDAFVGGLDWRWRAPGGDYVTGGQVVTSTLSHGPARQVADGTVNASGDVGYGAQTYFNKEGGEHVVWGMNANAQSRKLDFNDLGFNPRANTLAAGGGLGYRELNPWWIMREAEIHADVGRTYNTDGLLIGNGYYLESWGKFKNLWNYYTDAHFRGSKFDDREVGDGAALERAGRVGHEIYVGSDTTKLFSAGLDQISDAVVGGVSLQGNLFFTVRVMPQFDFDVLPSWVYARGEPRFVENGTLAGQYIFGKQEAKSFGTTFRATYTFTPRLTLQAYAQLFLASGHYTELSQFQSDPNGARPSIRVADLSPFNGALAANPDFEQAALNVNVVLRWEYLLGSTLFLVYTRAQVPSITLNPGDVGTLSLPAVQRAPAADAVLLKVSYWWGG